MMINNVDLQQFSNINFNNLLADACGSSIFSQLKKKLRGKENTHAIFFWEE